MFLKMSKSEEPLYRRALVFTFGFAFAFVLNFEFSNTLCRKPTRQHFLHDLRQSLFDNGRPSHSGDSLGWRHIDGAVPPALD